MAAGKTLLRRRYGGRPGRKPKAGERVHLGIRVTPEMKGRLEATASSSGRSQSQEAEMRLARSFDRQDLLSEVLTLAYGREVAGMLMMLGQVLVDTPKFFEPPPNFSENEGIRGPWTLDPRSIDRSLQAATLVLNAFRSEGSRKGSEPHWDPSAARIIGLVRSDDWTERDSKLIPGRDPFADPAKTIRSLLGPLATRLKEPKP
jgi:hypothetical protein